jgi:hypothetical protein
MAGYNSINVGRYNRWIQKLLSMKGPVTLESINPELHPVLQTYHGIEELVHQGWDMFGTAFTQNAVAAQFPAQRFRNPTGSNIVAVFTKIAVGSTTGLFADLTVQALNTDLSTTPALNLVGLDTRGRNAPSLKYSNEVAVGTVNLANIIARDFTAVSAPMADFIKTREQGIPLLPGNCIQVTGPTANNSLVVAWRWQERFLEESERT